MLTAQDLHDAFMELGELARREGKVIDLAVYGGSALMLASNFRVSTQDVDAVVEGDQRTIMRLAEAIARARGWARTWLNDGVRTYLSPHVEGLTAHHTLFRAYPSEAEPGLRVFVPTPEYLLAMKLMAMRIDPAAGTADLADILNLFEIIGITTPEEATSFAAAFYPEARISARLQLGIRAVWRIKEQEAQHVSSPTYLGRSGPTP
jgi:hypothetical protein